MVNLTGIARNFQGVDIFCELVSKVIFQTMVNLMGIAWNFQGVDIFYKLISKAIPNFSKPVRIARNNWWCAKASSLRAEAFLMDI